MICGTPVCSMICGGEVTITVWGAPPPQAANSMLARTSALTTVIPNLRFDIFSS
jgi:hypothetical protein